MQEIHACLPTKFEQLESDPNYLEGDSRRTCAFCLQEMQEIHAFLPTMFETIGI